MSFRYAAHPLALFSLVPFEGNANAEAALAHSDNRHLVWTEEDGSILKLDVGFHIRSKSSTTLATIGRNDTDIRLHCPSISKLQCSFEIDLDTNVIMLYDRSFQGSTHVYGDKVAPFLYGHKRRVVVQGNLNTIIGMGGRDCNLYLFELEWRQDPPSTLEKVRNRQKILCGYEDPPFLARTIFDEEDTESLSRPMTKPHTTGSHKCVRYATIGDSIGSGEFGTVWKAVDADTGKLMAVKILKQPKEASKEAE